jgi:uncharacterized protein YciI
MMSYFAVIREAGPGWADGLGAMEQPGVSDHAGFMNGLAEEGVVLFAGPLAGTEPGRFRALLIFDAETEAEIKRRLADDPWHCAERLQVTQIEPWTILVGAERLQSAHTASGAAV